jgi:uncharacterized protein YlxW (UPF0749 family)
MRHIMLAALGAIVALPVTVGAHAPDTGLYGFGITAAFSAGAFFAHSRNLEKHTEERFERLRVQLEKLAQVFKNLSNSYAMLRTSVEEWKARIDLALESQSCRIGMLEEQLPGEPA